MPTGATPKLQPHWMKWRGLVTCRKRDRERERKELILNITVCVVRVWWSAI
jgi:hypothetical protein